MNNTLLVRLVAAVALSGALHFASASPGAHGPNGEHLDGPAGTVARGNAPRFETKSEGFELVGRLSGGELSMFINRYETNEPVNGAKVELELGKLKAVAPFHSDQGDYAVADEAFLKALAQPGDHALVITIVAGNDADLLEGTLTVPANAPGSEHHHAWERPAIIAGGVVAVVLASVAFVRLRSRGRLVAGGAQ